MSNTLCPTCGSSKIWKDGTRQTLYGDVQRFLCRDCGFRFSEHGSNGFYPCSSKGSICQVGATQPPWRVKNLVTVEPLNERQAGATVQNVMEQKGRTAELAWSLKKANYADETIRMVNSALRTLMTRHANLSDPESVKEVIVTQNWSENRKRNVANAYNLYAKKFGITWQKPKTKFTRKMPFIPKEEELDALIARAGKKLSTFLQLLKETAMRSGEATKLKWIDIDEERRLVTLNAPEKGSNPRIWKVSSKLINMLNALPRKTELIFGNPNTRAMRSIFCGMRKGISIKLQNPRLLRISFHTFRHWKATSLYHQTKNILLVKEFLGHAKIENTLLYIQIEQAVFGAGEDDEFTVQATSNKEEIKQLLSVGFEYVCQKDDMLFFRKRK